MFRRLKMMARYPLAGVLAAGLVMAAMVAGAGTASAATRAGHTISGAGTLALGKKTSGGGGAIDFWKVKLFGGDQVQLTVQTPNVTFEGTNQFELFAPGTNDTDFPQAIPQSATNTPGGSTKSVITLQAPYNGTFILAVCENVNGNCTGVDSGSGTNPMGPYTFTPTLIGGGVKSAVAAKETKAAATIARAPLMPVGRFEAGGGNPVDLWKVKLSGGDRVQLSVQTPLVTFEGTNQFELFAPGTNDTDFPQAIPVSATNTPGGSSKSVITLQAPYNGTFILAVCENVNGNCTGVDSGSGTNPMGPYTFTDTLIKGGIKPAVAARETRAATRIAKAPLMPVGNFEAGGGDPIDFWKVHLSGGDKVQLSVQTPWVTFEGTNEFELFKPGTTDTSFPQNPPVSSASTPGGTTTSTVTLQAPSTGTFVLAVCENVGGDCRGVDSGGGTSPMGPYTFTDTLVGGHETRTTLKLSSSSVTSGHEKSLSLSVTVAARFGKAVPGGTVTITAGKKKVCSVKLSKGKGKCSPSSNTLLPPGSYSLVASYGGAKGLEASQSAAQKLTVKKG
jgi:Bacterial Ig-like domain (group 3)